MSGSSLFAFVIAATIFIVACGKKEKAPHPSMDDKAHHTVYHCAMHPQIIKNGPGDCPLCGMALVPIETEASDSGSPKEQEPYPKVRVDESTARRIGIRVISLSHPSLTENRLNPSVYIPAQALVRTGDRHVVVVYLDNGLYQPRDVKVGVETRTSIEVVEGLEFEDRIVVSGQFLLMSQSELQAKGAGHE